MLKKLAGIVLHCIADPSSSGAAQGPTDGCFETQFASCTMSTTLVQEQQPDVVQRGVGDTRKAIAAQADSGNTPVVGTHSDWREVELMSTNEPKRSSFATRSDMAAQSWDPECFNDVVPSHIPYPSQHEVEVSNTAMMQKIPKWNENNDFEKLCLAYSASLNLRQNTVVFDKGRSQAGQALTRDPFDGSISQVTSTSTTMTTTSKSLARSRATALSEVAPTLEKSDSEMLVDPSLVTLEGLLTHGPPAQNTCAAVDLCVSDACQMDVDVMSTDHQVSCAQEPVSSAVISAAEPLSDCHPYQLDFPRLPVPGQAQPQPAPGSSHHFHESRYLHLILIPPYTHCIRILLIEHNFNGLISHAHTDSLIIMGPGANATIISCTRDGVADGERGGAVPA